MLTPSWCHLHRAGLLFFVSEIFFSHVQKIFINLLSLTVNMGIFSHASAVGLSSQPMRSDVEGCTVHSCPVSIDYNHSQGVWLCYSLTILLFSLKLNSFDLEWCRSVSARHAILRNKERLVAWLFKVLQRLKTFPGNWSRIKINFSFLPGNGPRIAG